MFIRLRALALTALAAGVLVFYVWAANEHAERVNLSKARGDQSGYLLDAEHVWANWHDPEHNNILVGERNRMPIYAGYLALFYRPTMTDPEFFVVGRRANIYLSVALLILLAFVLGRELPPLPAANLTGIVAFGYFIFKAGYTQSELLFYFLFFLTFLGAWHALQPRQRASRTAIVAVITGIAAALAHLTKAAMPPFVALFTVMFLLEPWAALASGRRRLAEVAGHRALWTAAARRALAAAGFVIAFLTVLWPYIATNKRVFGHYFYNVNSTFYVWYDDWASASVGVRLHGDGHHWPTVAPAEIPSAARYWREHTIGQMATRLGDGFENMAIVSYRTYNFLWYALLYAVMTGVVAVSRWRSFRAMLGEHAWLTVFVALYFSMYAVATAFYFPISGTGTARFFMAHLLPFFFVLSRVLSSPRFAAAEWRVFGRALRLAHFHGLITILLAADVAFHVWPRLMSTYGGF